MQIPVEILENKNKNSPLCYSVRSRNRFNLKLEVIIRLSYYLKTKTGTEIVAPNCFTNPFPKHSLLKLCFLSSPQGWGKIQFLYFSQLGFAYYALCDVRAPPLSETVMCTLLEKFGRFLGTVHDRWRLHEALCDENSQKRSTVLSQRDQFHNKNMLRLFLWNPYLKSGCPTTV